MQITQCPECATAFKVTPEQLKLADGWVRCGRCGAVFEALKHVQAPTQAPPANAAQPQPSSNTAATPVMPPTTVPTTTPSSTAAIKPRTVAAPASTAEPVISADLGSALGPAMEPAFGPSFDPAWSPASSPALSKASLKEDPASHHDAPKKRWLWMGLTGLLVLALLWQMVLYKRDWLMAQEPALRGVLSALCAPVGCEPDWPRLPESLQVESSSFIHDPQGFYSVQVRVKNNAHFPLAAPHLELTLLDAYDDIVLRRVFTPQELKLQSAIAPLRDARAGLDFVLDAAVMERVTGYRVLLFYP